MTELYCAACGRGPLAARGDTSVPANMRHYARGLDGTCYENARYHGRLAAYPPVGFDPPHPTKPAPWELVADYDHEYAMVPDVMRTSLADAARRVGVSWPVLAAALAAAGRDWRQAHYRREPTGDAP